MFRTARPGWILRCIFFVAISAIVAAAGPRAAYAQSAVTGTATITGRVTDAAGKGVDGASVSLSGTGNIGSVTDTAGRFQITDVPFGTYSVTVKAKVLGSVFKSGLIVERDVDISIQYEAPTSLRTIGGASTGSQARFNVTAASVSPISPAAASFQGQTTWRQILEQVPGVSTLGTAGGYGNGVPDSPLQPAIVSINGAAGYETATVLDGMPLIGTSFALGNAGNGTDLASYPLNSFSTADIVRGPGALSPTIVDSIGGSVVLSSPGVVTHDSVDASLGSDPYGGFNSNISAALKLGHFTLRTTYGVNDSPGPVNGAIIAANPSVPLTVDGKPFSCTGGSCTTYTYAPGYTPYASILYGQNLLVCCSQQSTAWSQAGGSTDLRYAISPALSAEVFYAGQRSAVFQFEQEGDETPVDFAPPAGYTGAFPAGPALLYSFGGLTPVVQSSSLLEEKLQANLGDGVLRLAALQNKTYSSQSFSFFNGPQTVQLYGGGDVNGVPVVFNGSTHTITQDAFDYVQSNTASNRDLSASYDAPIGAHANGGISYVQSYYNSPSNEYYTLTYQGVSYPPTSYVTSPADSETTDEIRLHFGVEPTETTSLEFSYYDLLARYHVPNPNDLTENVNRSLSYGAPRVGFVWRPKSTISTRVSAGGGIALAPLSYLIGTNGTPTLNDTAGSPPGYSVTVTNLNLHPETSFGYDLGADFRLPQHTVLSLDAYRDTLFGQLFESTNVTGTYMGLPLYTSEYENLGVSRFEGVLASVRREVPKGIYGGISVGLTRGFVVSVPNSIYNEATCTKCANLYVVPGINFNGGNFGSLGAAVPYSQASANIGYRWSPHTYVEFDPTYYGPNNSYYRPAFVEADAHISQQLGKNVSLLFTFRNLTGAYDASTNSLAFSNLKGIPTISGLPYSALGGEYGPRSLVVSTQFHF